MITFVVPGRPQAWQRATPIRYRDKMGQMKTGKIKPKKTKSYQDHVAWLAKQAMSATGMHNPTRRPVKLMVEITMEIPKTWPDWKYQAAKNGFIEPTGKPDADNIVKTVKDALNKVYWEDDSQVVYEFATMKYGLQSEVMVTLEEMISAPSQVKSKKEFDQLMEQAGVLF